MVLQGHLAYILGVGELLGDDLVRMEGMGAHLLHLVSGQVALLGDDGLGHPEHADVVQEGPAGQVEEAVSRELELDPHGDGQDGRIDRAFLQGRPLDVAAEDEADHLARLVLHGLDQGLHDGFDYPLIGLLALLKVLEEASQLGDHVCVQAVGLRVAIDRVGLEDGIRVGRLGG